MSMTTTPKPMRLSLFFKKRLTNKIRPAFSN
jgi:hypothetical protein